MRIRVEKWAGHWLSVKITIYRLCFGFNLKTPSCFIIWNGKRYHWQLMTFSVKVCLYDFKNKKQLI